MQVERDKMTIAEFIRSIKKQGIKLKSHGSRHDVYWNPGTGQCAQIPRHQTQDIKKGTMEKILKDLGIK